VGAGSLVEWTHNTHNTWIGCAPVSPGCRLCYAERHAERFWPGNWRRGGPRYFLSDAYWRKPLAWNRSAARAGVPTLVFCGSMCDFAETHPDPQTAARMDAARAQLWELIERTPWLTWQLLTKRPENVAALVPWGEDWPRNVWLGTSVEDQVRAEQRIPQLLAISAKTRFLSCEPLLGAVDLSRWLGLEVSDSFGRGPELGAARSSRVGPAGGLHWIIGGGESGPGARPMHPAWAESLRDQAVAAGVPYFHKQHGEYTPAGPVYGVGETAADFDESMLEVSGTGCALDVDGTEPVRWTSRTVTIDAVPRAGAWWMSKVGKKAAGRELGGRVWQEMPERWIPSGPPAPSMC
jgi:protein gp37